MAHQYSPAFERVGRGITRHSALVILVWILIAVGTNLAWPQLETVANERSVAPFPSDAPSISAMHEMAEKFNQKGADNVAIVAMTNPGGYNLGARAHYSALVQRLNEGGATTFVQDLLGAADAQSNPTLRKQVLSADGTAWYLLVGVRGDLGSPEAMQSLKSIKNTVARTFDGSTVTARVTGNAATMGDVAVQAISDTRLVGAITFAVITVLLLVIYRSVFTASLPLIVMGMSVVVARGTVAGLSLLGMPISSTSSALMVAIVAGACVNYTVFYISRYHENLRLGLRPDEAIARTSGSMTRVILATAATVAIANLAQVTAKLQALAASGPAVAVAITIGFLVTVTMLPAILHLAAKRGIGFPKAALTEQLWRRIGVYVVRNPVVTLLVALLTLGGLAAFAPSMRFSYDDRAAQPKGTDSSEGYAMLNAHFPSDSMLPQYLIINSPKDLRTPEGLADLEQMAQRVSQLPGVTRIVGITRPDGSKITQATLAWQIGTMGKQLARAKDSAKNYVPQLDRVQQIADLVSQLAQEFDANELSRINSLMTQAFSQAGSATGQLNRYSSLLDRLSKSGPQLDQLAGLAPTLKTTAMTLTSAIALIEPIYSSMKGSRVCTDLPQCVQLRNQLAVLIESKNSGALAALGSVSTAIDAMAQSGTPPSKLISDMKGQLATAQSYIRRIGEFKARYDRANDVLRRVQLLGLSNEDAEQMGDRVREMRRQTEEAMGGLTELAAYLQTVGTSAKSPSASGFYLPDGILSTGDFGSAAALFISPDGKMARYMLQTSVDPYSPRAMELTRLIASTAREATPNTSLAGAEVAVGGLSAILGDLREVFKRDFVEIIVVTLLIILAVMCLLLRSIVAPVYLLATVILTYLAALGAGVLLFQVILGKQLYWAVPAMTFVLVVAVGADYNMLYMSRLREESQKGFRIGVLRSVGYTGSVITSAGMIFAAAMFGMMAGSISMMYQMGFIIGAGILIDTFIVRTLIVPAIATVLGSKSWWPAKS
ncbi:RND family transporter [Gordonia sp. CPCC 205333]|uniref:MMPL/RND family transporter n=1 Tax=Gordonia sp. CPCC 205333 TaxID=3140790 RepID=UPI003AF3B07F